MDVSFLAGQIYKTNNLKQGPMNQNSRLYIQGTKKVIFTACHLGKLKLAYTSRSTPRSVQTLSVDQPLFQALHTDEVNQCLRNKSCSHGVQNANLFDFTFLLVDFGKVLCSSANELQQNSNASSRAEYIPDILTVLLQIHHVYI